MFETLAPTRLDLVQLDQVCFADQLSPSPIRLSQRSLACY